MFQTQEVWRKVCEMGVVEVDEGFLRFSWPKRGAYIDSSD